MLGLVLLAAGCAAAGGEGSGLVLTVTDVDRGRVLARERVEPGSLITLAYVHSTEGRPVRATLRVEAGHTLRLIETAFPSVGPGLPPLGPAGTWAIEGGLIVNRGASAALPELRLRAVPITQHRLILPSGRTLDLSALAEPGSAIRLAVQ